MVTVDSQHKVFQDRLKRVSAGGANTMSQIYTGPAEEVAPRRKTRAVRRAEKQAARHSAKRASRKAREKEHANTNVLIAVLMGLLVGGVGVLLARYARFRLFDGSLTGPNADLIMVADLVLGLTIAILLRTVFRYRSRAHGAAKFAGVMAMVMLMQNMVHYAPGPFRQVFSTQWVNRVVATTKPNSLLVAGVSYVSGADIPLLGKPLQISGL